MKQKTIAKLLELGFAGVDGQYSRPQPLVGGQMTLTVTVSPCGEIAAEVIDEASGEEYVLHQVPGAVGAFVGQIRAEYEAALDEIRAACSEFDAFVSPQSGLVIDHAGEKYGDELEFLWQKFPGNAVFRRKDNQKWYAALLTVSRRKLGMDSDETVEILDLRMEPERIPELVDGMRYFPGYHMNKKHWITICLDGTVPIGEIRERIDASWLLAGNGRKYGSTRNGK